ncbi:hypothetical protein T484DRAFT_1884022, partial [Baffinella frigidus]
MSAEAGLRRRRPSAGRPQTLAVAVLFMCVAWGVGSESSDQALQIVSPLGDSKHPLGGTPTLETIVRLGAAGWDNGDHVGAEILAHIDGSPFASLPVNPSECSSTECRVRVPAPQGLAAGEHVATLLLLLVSAAGDKDVAAEDSLAFSLLDLPAPLPPSAPPPLPDPARAASLGPSAAILFVSPAKNNTSFLDPRAVALRFRVLH